MFVQVIKAHTSDPAAVRSHAEQWRTELKPSAPGFLGSTGGVADDGTVVFLARFEDEEAARANAARPEQSAWWEGMEALFDQPAAFQESTDTSTLFDGGSNEAGFVQIMQGTVTDRAKAEALESSEMVDQLRAARPDLIGSLRVWHDGGTFTDAVYFTSEADARTGESGDAFQGPQQEYMDLFSDMSFIDLKDPLLD